MTPCRARRTPVPTSTTVVADILRHVRAEGDEALVRYTAEFDRVDVSDGLRVPPDEIEKARADADPDLWRALEVAFGRILAYHAHEGMPPGDLVEGGITVGHLTAAVERAGIYAPGGRARYPSTVLMCAAPARVAGVGSIALCVPPAADGRIDAATLCAASIAGVDEVYRVGGAQAIAAMAYGTASLPAVDVIAGPGNAYVAEAKRQLSGVVGVASAFAGPSEIVVVAGPDAPAPFAAIDLVVQAEHGPDGLAWLVTWDAALAEEISAEVDRIVAASSRRADLEATLAAAGIVCLVDGPEQALAVANAVAPEHLQLMVPEEEGLALLGLVQNAGAVFIGMWSPASMGDYIAGPNHVLPTNRTARFASALRADDFRKHLHAVRVTPDALRTLGPLAVTLAETEGLPAHADSVRLRLGRPRRARPARRRGAVSAVPPVRPDLQLSEGYHSPQVEAEVRLNTNESPFAPPDAWREEVLAALREVSFHRYPDRPATELRQAIADLHGVTPAEVFCANGSNEVLQCLLLAFGGPGRRALVFEPTYALHAHIARITGTEVVEGARDDDFQIDTRHARDLLARRAPRRHVPVLAQQPDRSGGAARHGGRRLRGGARPRHRRRGLRAVLPVVGADAARRRAARAGRDAHLLQDVGHGRRTAGVPGGRPGRRGGVRGGRACRTTCPRRRRWPAWSRCATCPRWRRGSPASPRSGGGWPPRSATCRSTAGPPTPTSSCSGPATGTPPRCGARSWSGRSSSATAPAGTACAAACVSPSGRPTRTTASSTP